MVRLERRVDDLEQALGRGALDRVGVPVVDRGRVARGLAHDVAVDALVGTGDALLGHDRERLLDPAVEVIRVGDGLLLGGRGGVRHRGGGDALGAVGPVGRRTAGGGRGSLSGLAVGSLGGGGSEGQLDSRVNEIGILADDLPVAFVQLLPAAAHGMLASDLGKSFAGLHGMLGGRGLRGGIRLRRHGGGGGGRLRGGRRGGGEGAGGADHREGENGSTGGHGGEAAAQRDGPGTTVLTLCGHGEFPLRRLRGELSGSDGRCLAAQSCDFTPSRSGHGSATYLGPPLLPYVSGFRIPGRRQDSAFHPD